MKKTIFILCITLLSACIPRSASESEPNGSRPSSLVEAEIEFTELIGTRWELQSMNGHKPLIDTLITLEISSKRFSGSAGCNAYWVDYSVEGKNHYSITFAAWEIEACAEPEGILEQEETYRNLLNSSTSYHRNGDELSLLDQQGIVLLRYQFQP